MHSDLKKTNKQTNETKIKFSISVRNAKNATFKLNSVYLYVYLQQCQVTPKVISRFKILQNITLKNYVENPTIALEQELSDNEEEKLPLIEDTAAKPGSGWASVLTGWITKEEETGQRERHRGQSTTTGENR